MTAVADVSLFESWQSGDLEELLLEARMQDYTINRVVVRDSLDSTFFFVVVRGKCRVLKEIDVKKLGWSHGLRGHTNARHFHLSELAPSKYSQTATCNNTNSLSKQHIGMFVYVVLWIVCISHYYFIPMYVFAL